MYVLYEDEPDLWHERLVWVRVLQSGSYLVVSPDEDKYIEDFESTDILYLIIGNSKRHLPACLGAARGRPVYRFSATFSALKITRLIEEARTLVDDELVDHQDEYAPVLVEMDGSDGAVWFVMSPGGPIKEGSPIDPVDLELHGVVLDNFALIKFEGHTYTLEKLRPEAVHDRLMVLRAAWGSLTPRGSGPAER